MGWEWDVFISYDRTDTVAVERIEDALREEGLRVFRDTSALSPDNRLAPEILKALSTSKVVLAYYSATYPTRPPCQAEFSRAFLAGQATGDPLARLLVVNPEPDLTHLQPVQIREVLLPGAPVTATRLRILIEAVRSRLSAVTEEIGSVDVQVRWTTPQPRRKPAIIGRWAQLWQLHSFLKPNRDLRVDEPPSPVVVLYGVTGVGKTELAAAYAATFGSSYPEVAWFERDLHADLALEPGSLVIVDDARHVCEPPPQTAMLLVTRDPHLAASGQPVELTDLAEHELPMPASLREDTAGSTALALRMATGHLPEEDLRASLYAFRPTALKETAGRLTPIVDELGAWDVIRVFCAISPLPATRHLVTDVLSSMTRDAAPLDEVDSKIAALLAGGVLDGLPTSEEFALPRSFVLALQGADQDRGRAEQLRKATLRILSARTRPGHQVIRSKQRTEIDEAERLAAHRIRVEVTRRVAVRKLPAGEGSFQAALRSLYRLITFARETQRDVHPLALRVSSAVRPGLGTLLDRLIEEILEPFLTHWHTRLDQYHELRPAGVGSRDHELAWEQHDEFRAALVRLQNEATDVAAELSVISGW